MGQLTRRRALMGAVAIGGVGALSLGLAGCGGKSKGVVGNEDMTMGDPKAPVTMIEYGSLSCAHCGDWNANVLPAFKAKYIDTGKIFYVFRPFQLGPGDSYTAAADLLGRCAGKDRYFPVVDALFHSQQEALMGGNVREVLLRVAAQASMNESQVSACLSDEKAVAAQATRLTAGQAKEVRVTPTFFINGEKYESALPLTEIDKAYEAAMAKKK